MGNSSATSRMELFKTRVLLTGPYHHESKPGLFKKSVSCVYYSFPHLENTNTSQKKEKKNRPVSGSEDES